MNVPHVKEGCYVITATALVFTGSYYLYNYIKTQEDKLNTVYQYVMIRTSKEQSTSTEELEEKKSSYFSR